MSSALILDTETTGLTDPDVIELAWMGPLHAFSPPDEPVQRVRFRPRKPIELAALATHHILDEELEAEPQWTGAWSPGPADYLIGHNVDFDWKAIGSPSIKRICTLALARHLWPELDSHSLGALIYHFFPDRKAAREFLKGAHGAARDVEACCQVLVRVLAERREVCSWEQLYQLSETARIPTHLSFGKYGPYSDWARITGHPRGILISTLRKMDSPYLSWLLNGKCDQVNGDEYLRRALEAV